MQLGQLLLGVTQVQLIFLIQYVGLELLFTIWKEKRILPTQALGWFYSHGEYKSSCERKKSLVEVVSNVIAAGKYLGWWASKHFQTSQDKDEYYKYPSGREIMKAINGNDGIYIDKNGKLIEIRKKTDLKNYMQWS